MAYLSVYCPSVCCTVLLTRRALHCMAGFSEGNGEDREYCLTLSHEKIRIKTFKTCKFGNVRRKSTLHTCFFCSLKQIP